MYNMKLGNKKSGNINTLGNKMSSSFQMGDKFKQRSINDSVRKAQESNIYENKSNNEQMVYLPVGLKNHSTHKKKSPLEK